MTKTKTKTKAAAIVAVPQTREEASAQLGRVGELRRGIVSLKGLADAQVAAIGEQLEANIDPMRAELAALEKGLQTWAEANRAAITNGNRVKFADLGTGRVSWRSLPPKVTIRGVDVVIEGIKKLGLAGFLRTKEEINKEAMLADPEKARSIQGVTIGAEGEEFEITPAEIAVAERQGA